MDEDIEMDSMNEKLRDKEQFGLGTLHEQND